MSNRKHTKQFKQVSMQTFTERAKGKLWVSRVAQEEIQQDIYGQELVFARRSKRSFHMVGEHTEDRLGNHSISHVQQYKFIRLERRANYEPLIMALKGLQIAVNPGDYMTAAQLSSSKALRNQYQRLKEWSSNPTQISRRTRGRFLDTVKIGLMDEANHKPAHKLHYIDWALGAIDIQLRLFNKEIERHEVFEKTLSFSDLIQSIPFNRLRR